MYNCNNLTVISQSERSIKTSCAATAGFLMIELLTGILLFTIMICTMLTCLHHMIDIQQEVVNKIKIIETAASFLDELSHPSSLCNNKISHQYVIMQSTIVIPSATFTGSDLFKRLPNQKYNIVEVSTN